MIIYGIGGIAIVAVEVLESLGITVDGYFDDVPNVAEYNGLSVMSSEAHRRSLDSNTLICVGHNPTRRKLIEQLAANVNPLIHPTAIVSDSANIGKNSIVFHASCVQANATIGRGVILNTSVNVDHDCVISDYVHISPKVTLCGGVSVGEESNIGANCVVIPNVSIGRNVTIGAGSVIIRDVPAGATVVGNPGRLVRS